MTLIPSIYIKNRILIDLRESDEYKEDHIQGALNFPISCFLNKVNELKRLSKPLILYSYSAKQTAYALEILKRNDIKEVYNGEDLERFRETMS